MIFRTKVRIFSFKRMRLKKALRFLE